MPKLTGVRERRRRTKRKTGSFAPLVGYSRSGFISIENGTRPASPEGAQRIADVLTDLGVPTRYEDLVVPDPPPEQPKRPKGPPRRRKQKDDEEKPTERGPKRDNDSMRVAS